LGSMPEHSDQSLSSEEYNALLVHVTQWLEQAPKQAGGAVNALMTTTYWRIVERIFEQEQRGGERGATENALWNSSPGICRHDLAAGFLVPTYFKCASFTSPIEPSPDGVWTFRRRENCPDSVWTI
jgi:hypothetical protein